MRQGEVAPRGKWEGVLGGVRAPDAIVLADPLKRFTNTSARLAALAPGHPMEDWLRFMSHLARAQQAAAAMAKSPVAPELSAVEQAIEARMPLERIPADRRQDAAELRAWYRDTFTASPESHDGEHGSDCEAEKP